MDFQSIPKRSYTEGFTPIVKLENLSRILGGPNIYMKRDDLLGLAAGGNKTRKLEFLMADAIEKGAPGPGGEDKGQLSSGCRRQ